MQNSEAERNLVEATTKTAGEESTLEPNGLEPFYALLDLSERRMMISTSIDESFAQSLLL